MKRTWLLPLCVATLALGGCVVRETAAPPPRPSAYIPPGSALGVTHLPPPVPLTPPGYVAPVAEDTAPMGAAESQPPSQVGSLGTLPVSPPTSTDIDSGASGSWEVAAPASPDSPADTSKRLDEIRARLAQDRTNAPAAMPSRFGGLSNSGDIAPSGN